VGLLATEMVSAEGFYHKAGALKGCVERLWGVKDEPRPLAVQMWDNDPETLVWACRKLAFEYQVSTVDLNFGCPVRKVSEKAESGSYLLRFPAKVHEIVARVVKACAPVPVTAKIRLGSTWDNLTHLEVARAVEEGGAAALTVHGRVAADYFKGRANWEKIAEVKTVLQEIPLIGNGDINSPAAVLNAFRRYRVDGVMIGRAALGRPWIFKQAAQALKGEAVAPEPDLTQQAELLLRHQRLIVERYGEETGNMLMRKFGCCYAQGHPGARAFRARASRCRTNAEFEQIVRELFPREQTGSHS
jgi:tRNA-dihydrouridine synthase B